ncbi:MAG: prolyl oligopeptidase family serine peptidase [Planctomycetaceae bacterium]|nr:prolyl oligopeptidase family serine peptidase [Planctomycetaceae bacterium]
MRTLLLCLPFTIGLSPAFVQAQKPSPKFSWVTPPPKSIPPRIVQAKFRSQANQADVGYCILLPLGYEDPASESQRYPVIYWLHGGRPGSEWKAANMAPYFLKAMQAGTLPPVIYVFPNGGRLSHYDHEGFQGEQAFLELIEHIDGTYRTIASRAGRAVEGFSQGGRGTGRYMLKHPELFCSAAPMGGGHQHELRISENNGAESESLTISPAWNNTWDLAKRFAESGQQQPRILVVDGDADFNFEANQQWHEHLTNCGIKSEFIIVPGAKHSAKEVYDQVGDQIIQFHVESFRQTGALPAAE